MHLAHKAMAGITETTFLAVLLILALSVFFSDQFTR